MKSLVQWIRENVFHSLTPEQKAYKAWDELSDYFLWSQAKGTFALVEMIFKVEEQWNLLTKDLQRYVLEDILEAISTFEKPWFGFSRFEKKFYEQHGEWPFGEELSNDF